jgi:undecaprenyl-diphosphatase
VSVFESFDTWTDGQLERLRGNAVADTIFTSASDIADFSLIWHLVGVGRMIRRPPTWRQSVAFSALLGVESLLVNQGVKRLFRRIRPTTSGDPRFPVRKPLTSSFPSGHASSAFFAAAILTKATSRSLAPLWYSTAVVVAISRAYVRIHHPSDVVAGAAVGAALGVAGAQVFKALDL